VRDYPIQEFVRGLAIGGTTLAVALGVAAAAGEPRSAGRLAPLVGLPITVAALVAIGVSRTPTPEVVVGLSGVTTAAALAGARRPAGLGPRLVLPLLLAAPFAWLLAADSSRIAWVRAVVVAGATVGPVVAARTDTDWGATGVTPALYAVSAAGVFAAVPDTEAAAALLGVSVPSALTGWPLGGARLGRGGAASSCALLVWVSGVGALGREVAIVGAVACLGLLVTLPAGRWLAGRAATAARWHLGLIAGPLPVLVVQIGVVSVASRVAGTSAELWMAVPAATMALVVGVAVGSLLQTTAITSGSRSR
jgi:hypothetical protein